MPCPSSWCYERNASIDEPNHVATSIPFAWKRKQIQFSKLNVLFGVQKPNKTNNNIPWSVFRNGFVMIKDMEQRCSHLTVVQRVQTSGFHIGVSNCQKTYYIDVYPASAGGIHCMCCILMALVCYIVSGTQLLHADLPYELFMLLLQCRIMLIKTIHWTSGTNLISLVNMFMVTYKKTNVYLNYMYWCVRFV
jgi:hypothetical protein